MPEKSDYFQTFCKVSRAFGTTLKREKLLDLIVLSAIDTMGGKASCLFFEDEQKHSDVFVPIAQKGLSKSYLHAEPKEAKRAAEEIMKKGYIAIHDATTDQRVKTHALKKKEGIASILVVPVIVKERVKGVLTLYTAKPRIFSGEEIQFLTALAEQGGLAIERARLVMQITQNIRIFSSIAEGLNESLDIKVIMERLSVDMVRALGVKAVSVRLIDKDKGVLELVASHGLSKKYLNKGPVRIEKSVTEALAGKTVVIRDATSNREVQYKDEKKKEGIASILTVPIKVKDEVIGVMRYYSETERDFTEGEVMLAEGVASLGGLAIHNASMYLMLKQDMQCLKEDIWSHRSWF
ncbi:MAG TPA: GAF domain-containing protein [Deltaproteobacteria bacterium]|nr:GAF domain-containing protein [Deltaproteobacteria bacterium]HPR55521.1 GAF domain-containing protein [Deltaproteobacteria bacterium]HXK48355.1 GAF domain-containing protein [Deltaproteobacteria bacterium]